MNTSLKTSKGTIVLLEKKLPLDESIYGKLLKFYVHPESYTYSNHSSIVNGDIDFSEGRFLRNGLERVLEQNNNFFLDAMRKGVLVEQVLYYFNNPSSNVEHDFEDFFSYHLPKVKDGIPRFFSNTEDIVEHGISIGDLSDRSISGIDYDLVESFNVIRERGLKYNLSFSSLATLAFSNISGNVFLGLFSGIFVYAANSTIMGIKNMYFVDKIILKSKGFMDGSEYYTPVSKKQVREAYLNAAEALQIAYNNTMKKAA